MKTTEFPAKRALTKKIIINEFLAKNSTGITDEDGDHEDWIELYNPGEEVVNLEGWSITDNIKKPTKWVFPAVSINPESYLIIWASSKDRIDPDGELHTNFGLSTDGEYLGIYEPDGTVSDEYTPEFPPQTPDVSYGYYGGEQTYLKPTPGADNEPLVTVDEPVFSVQRGYYTDPVTVELSIDDPDADIYYTTDGTRPTAASTRYSGPIRISSTTPLSAVGVKQEAVSAVVTHTYIFIADVLKQPNDPAGYPDRWGYVIYGVGKYGRGERIGADYEMDPEICFGPEYGPLMEGNFKSIPAMCIVTNPGNLFSYEIDPDTGGIYIYTGDSGVPSELGGQKTGRGWERPVSLEYFDPNTGEQFQINCGLRLHGGNSRKPDNSIKYGFRAAFRKQYGSGKLQFPLFKDSTATDKFDNLILRAQSNYTWIHNSAVQRENAQYITDSFGRQTQIATDHFAPHDKFVHLYINGLYWGLYDVSERVDKNFFADYGGGKDDDYDIISNEYTGINDAGIENGNDEAYKEMIALGTAGNYEELVEKSLLDFDNYIDYMLMQFYVANLDWGKNNWFTGRKRNNPEGGFKYIAWDVEWSLTDVNLNRIAAKSIYEENGFPVSETDTYDPFEGPMRTILFGHSKNGIPGGLYQNAEFRLRFVDRVQRLFFNDGALTPAQAEKLYRKLAAEIDQAIIGESARWGDERKMLFEGTETADEYPTYTRDEYWLPRLQDLLENYFPYRTQIVFNQLKNLGLYTRLDAPEVAAGNTGITLENANQAGTVYYTTDGSDPRLTGGAVSEAAVEYTVPFAAAAGTIVKARIKSEDEWSALLEVTI